MARIYLETAIADYTGVKVRANVSTISATTRVASNGSLVETFTQGDVTVDATGRYSVRLTPGAYGNDVPYYGDWTVCFSGGSQQKDKRYFTVTPLSVSAADLPGHVVIGVDNSRQKVIARKTTSLVVAGRMVIGVNNCRQKVIARKTASLVVVEGG